MKDALVPTEHIDRAIFAFRGQKALLDRDIAVLYQVTTKVLNQAVKRNSSRFPDDFMFQLSRKETDELVTNCDRFKSLKHSSSLPYAFTEQGVAMLSSVLNSERSIEVNIQIMPEADACNECRSCPQARGPGAEIRQPVPGCVRRHPGPYGRT
jgi:ORF6N domain